MADNIQERSKVAPVPHADELDACSILIGRTLDRPEVELVVALDRGLRQARNIIEELAHDRDARRVLRGTGMLDVLELFLEDEGNQSELCWMWEDEDGRALSTRDSGALLDSSSPVSPEQEQPQ